MLAAESFIGIDDDVGILEGGHKHSPLSSVFFTSSSREKATYQNFFSLRLDVTISVSELMMKVQCCNWSLVPTGNCRKNDAAGFGHQLELTMDHARLSLIVLLNLFVQLA